MFNTKELYTIKQIAEIANTNVQTIYKRRRNHGYPIIFDDDGVYKVYGNVANKLLVKDPRGPKTNRPIITIINNEKPHEKIIS